MASMLDVVSHQQLALLQVQESRPLLDLVQGRLEREPQVVRDLFHRHEA
jgi:hypothetical protein